MNNKKGTPEEILSALIEESVEKIVRAELNKFFEERFKNDNGSIQSVHNNIDDLRNRGLKNLQDTVNNLQREVNNLKNDVGGVRREISDLAEIRRPDGILSTIGKTVSSIFQSNEGEIKKLQEDLQSKNDALEEARRIYDERTRELERVRRESDNEIQRLKYDTQRISDELNAKKGELSDAKNEMSARRAELSKVQEELAQIRGDAEKLKTQLTNTEVQLSAARESEQKTGEKLKAWQSSTDIYAPVRDAMTQCPTFKTIIENNGLNDMSETGLMVYAQVIGATDDFVKKMIYDIAVETKKQTREFMTPEEAEVYAALNQLYRRIWNIEHDIFELPNKQSVSGTFQRCGFDANTSICLTEPRNKGFSFTTGVYVPILMKKEGGVAQKAYVDAGNR